MKTGFYRTTIKDDNKRFNNGHYHVVYRYIKDGKAISFSSTSINGLRDKAWANGVPWKITDEDAARDLETLEKKLILIDDNFYEKMDDLEEKEKQIVLEKQKLRNTRRQERSELLREYQKKHKGDDL